MKLSDMVEKFFSNKNNNYVYYIQELYDPKILKECIDKSRKGADALEEILNIYETENKHDKTMR